MNRKIIPAEQRYVRRTAEDFANGAALPKKGQSYRLHSVGLRITEDLSDAVTIAAANHGVGKAEFMRAALRYAIRNGIDVRHELNTPIEIDVLDTEPT